MICVVYPHISYPKGVGRITSKVRVGKTTENLSCKYCSLFHTLRNRKSNVVYACRLYRWHRVDNNKSFGGDVKSGLQLKSKAIIYSMVLINVKGKHYEPNKKRNVRNI